MEIIALNNEYKRMEILKLSVKGTQAKLPVAFCEVIAKVYGAMRADRWDTKRTVLNAKQDSLTCIRMHLKNSASA